MRNKIPTGFISTVGFTSPDSGLHSGLISHEHLYIMVPQRETYTKT